MGGVYRIQTFFGFYFYFYIYKAPNPVFIFRDLTLNTSFKISILTTVEPVCQLFHFL